MDTTVTVSLIQVIAVLLTQAIIAKTNQQTNKRDVPSVVRRVGHQSMLRYQQKLPLKRTTDQVSFRLRHHRAVMTATEINRLTWTDGAVGFISRLEFSPPTKTSNCRRPPAGQLAKLLLQAGLVQVFQK